MAGRRNKSDEKFKLMEMKGKFFFTLILSSLLMLTETFAQERPAEGFIPAPGSQPEDSVSMFPARDSSGAYVVPEGYALKDTVLYVFAPAADTLLVGRNVFDEMPSGHDAPAEVTVRQSEEIRRAMDAHFESNRARSISGYRVRIFFDNRQTARDESEKIMRQFMISHPDVPVYRSYVNPYFKVTAGDFRSKSEAMQLLQQIRGEFPSAFIVKEKSICYPAVDRHNAVEADTVKILYRLPEEVTA